MKLIPVFFLAVLLQGNGPLWLTDLDKAKQQAKEENKTVLLAFSGSDWCIPCIRMHKTLFESSAFESFAAKELVLANADFPRLKKHQLSKEQQAQNDELAERYNSSGKFPYTVLMNADGRVIKTWDGYPDVSPESFVEEINTAVYANK